MNKIILTFALLTIFGFSSCQKSKQNIFALDVYKNGLQFQDIEEYRDARFLRGDSIQFNEINGYKLVFDYVSGGRNGVEENSVIEVNLDKETVHYKSERFNLYYTISRFEDNTNLGFYKLNLLSKDTQEAFELIIKDNFNEAIIKSTNSTASFYHSFWKEEMKQEDITYSNYHKTMRGVESNSLIMSYVTYQGQSLYSKLFFNIEESYNYFSLQFSDNLGEERYLRAYITECNYNEDFSKVEYVLRDNKINGNTYIIKIDIENWKLSLYDSENNLIIKAGSSRT